MNALGRFSIVATAAFALSACVTAPTAATAPDLEREAIAANLLRDITVLASDEFSGRKPGTEGETRTVAFLIEEMRSAGLMSGTNDPGSAWRAPVGLVSTAPGNSEITFQTEGRTVQVGPEQGTAFTSASRLLIGDNPMIFVGFESDSVEPESIAGKVVVMLGEPGASAERRAQLFRPGPSAIITVVEDDAAIANAKLGFNRERVILASEERNRLTAYVTHSVMRRVNGEEHWNALVEEAASDSFSPGPLEPTVSIDAMSNRREFTSSNVLGLLPGTVRGSGAVLLLAHWDHLGECGEADDLICNGAVDNASGVAVMLELTRRLSASGPHDRDIYVLATTAEESGLLGAQSFVESPPVALASIVAAFNFDTSAVAPSGSAVGFVGEGRTVLDPVILEVMQESGRRLGSREFAESFVRRQDGWALLERGVPAVFLSTAFSSEIVLGPYLAEDYHRASDEIGTIELGGAIDDLLLHQALVERIANTALYTPPAKPPAAPPAAPPAVPPAN